MKTLAKKHTTSILSLALLAALAGAAASPARGDDWVIHATCDNQFDIYFGTRLATTFSAGRGTSWSSTYTFNAADRLPRDYVYIATASDQTQAQAFIGDFTNTTTSRFVVTGFTGWQVFAAGAHQATNPHWPNNWPASVLPTQAQVDTAIAYATENNLWRAPYTEPGGLLNGAGPWGFRPGIAPNAEWIWHRASDGPASGIVGSFDHDEFLVFRLSGQLTCVADLDDDGAMPQNPDGAVTIDDLLFFLGRFEEGSALADLDDNGALPQAPDGGVTVDDLLYFLIVFEQGC